MRISDWSSDVCSSVLASATLCSFSRSIVSASFFAFFESFAILSALHHVEAHRDGAALDDLRCRVQIVRVQVLHLGLGDLAERRALDGAGGNLARLLRARLDRKSTRLNSSH